jgi:hypothetical protein
MRITINNKFNDLILETFVFCCLISPTDSGIYLEEYILQERDTKKSKYRITESYYKLPNKISTLFEKDVPLTEDIKNMVLNEIIFRLEFKMLKDRKGKSKGKSI